MVDFNGLHDLEPPIQHLLFELSVEKSLSYLSRRFSRLLKSGFRQAAQLLELLALPSRTLCHGETSTGTNPLIANPSKYVAIGILPQ